MKFETYGDKKNKAVLLIHTLYTSAKFFEPIKELLSKKYYVILPTLSGHYENSLFVSTQDEINQITTFLKSENINDLYAVAGFSLGGNIAYEFFCQNSQMIEKAIIDSAPLFNFPKIIESYYYKRYLKCLKKIKETNCDIAKELNKYFNGMGEFQKDIAPKVALESLKPLVSSCFKTTIHKLENEESKKLIFIYGSKDHAKLCNFRLRKFDIIKMKGYGHCGFYRENPIGWAEKFI